MRQFDSLDVADHAIWSTVADAVQRLEASWRSGCPVDLGRLLPEPQDSARVWVLVELIKVDQEFRLESGQVKLTDAYLAEWPELVQSDAVVVELIRSECLTRVLVNVPPTDREIRERLINRPELFDQIDLPGIIAQAKAEESAGCALQGDTPCDGQEHTRRMTFGMRAYPVGARLGDYEIRAKLGQGGMGAVYLAYHPQLDCEVAIKVPHCNTHNHG